MINEPVFNFSVHDMKSMAPALEETLELDWPWPTSQQEAAVKGVEHATPQNRVPDEELCTPLTPLHRRFQVDAEGVTPTCVLSLNVDPNYFDVQRWQNRITLETEERVRSETLTRRVAVVLSAGRRVRFPLLSCTSEKAAGLLPTEWKNVLYPIFWEFPELNPSFEDVKNEVDPESFPLFAEVLVGELSDMVTLMEEVKKSWSDLRTVDDKKPMAPLDSRTSTFIHSKKSWATPAGEMKSFSTVNLDYSWPNCEQRHAKRSSRCPRRVSTFFLPTLPYALVWLQSGALLLSLTCEERLLTLDPLAHDSERCSWSGESTTAFRCPVVGSFALPRGVVPLDLVEVVGRNVVAVGTVDHGVLLCRLSTESSGAVTQIIRTITTCGLEGIQFPITKMIVLMPALRNDNLKKSSSAVSPSVKKLLEESQPLQSLQSDGGVPGGGMLIVCNALEMKFHALRLTGGGDGVEEDFTSEVFPPMEVLHTTSKSEIDPSVGVMLLTDTKGVCNFSLEWPEVGFSRTPSPVSRRSMAEHAPLRIIWDVPLTSSKLIIRVADGLPVFMNKLLLNHKPYLKHFTVAADQTNKILLIFRRPSSYSVMSTFTLTRNHSSELSEQRKRTASEAGMNERVVTEAKKSNLNDSGMVERNLFDQSCVKAEDCVVGLALFFLSQQKCFSAAVHNKRQLSVVSWSSKR